MLIRCHAATEQTRMRTAHSAVHDCSAGASPTVLQTSSLETSEGCLLDGIAPSREVLRPEPWRAAFISSCFPCAEFSASAWERSKRGTDLQAEASATVLCLIEKERRREVFPTSSQHGVEASLSTRGHVTLDREKLRCVGAD